MRMRTRSASADRCGAGLVCEPFQADWDSEYVYRSQEIASKTFPDARWTGPSEVLSVVTPKFGLCGSILGLPLHRVSSIGPLSRYDRYAPHSSKCVTTGNGRGGGGRVGSEPTREWDESLVGVFSVIDETRHVAPRDPLAPITHWPGPKLLQTSKFRKFGPVSGDCISRFVTLNLVLYAPPRSLHGSPVLGSLQSGAT